MIAIEPIEEHLRDHPLDGSSWLDYANWLTEQGDARGLQLYRGDVGKAGARSLAESPHLPGPLKRFWKAL